MRFDYIENSRADWGVFVSTRERIEKYIKDVKDKLILDVGCGQTAAQPLLFNNFGYRVVGIDMFPLERYRRLGKAGFPLNLRLRLGRIKRLIREYYFYKKYYMELEVLAGRPLSFKGLDVRQMDILKTEFPDGYFDAVISNAVFEHIPDIDAACSQIKRVTKKDGYLVIGIHLFPSLSGGHHDQWRDPASVREPSVPPWDHLRRQSSPVDPSLNRLRLQDYIRVFEKCFTILDLIRDESHVERSRRFLTPQIKTELSDYSEDELLMRSVVLIMKN